MIFGLKILLIDNNDSFTYNLVQLIEQSGFFCEVINDSFFNSSIEIIEEYVSKFEYFVFSPGPGLPSEAKGMNYILREYSDRNILGICLGHQAIAEHFGAKLSNHPIPFHGIKSQSKILNINNNKIFKNIPDNFNIGRYHSWYVDFADLPDCFEITCISEDNTIMGLSHKKLNIHGLQFHPESYLSEFGHQIIKNFMASSKTQ